MVRSPDAVEHEADRLVLVVEAQLAFVVGTAVGAGCRIVPSVVQADRGRDVVVKRVAGADTGMGQRLAKVKQQPAALVVVLIVVDRNDFGAQQGYESACLKTDARTEWRGVGQVVLGRI